MNGINDPAFVKKGLFYYCQKYDASWMLLNYINLNEKYEPWTSFDEANISFKPYRYSVLGLLSDEHKINDEFEFLLEYPEHNGYNRWYQSMNPLYDIEYEKGNGLQTAKGYREHTLSWKNNYFSGLMKSCSIRTLLDGTRNMDSTYYSIGRVEVYKTNGLCSFEEVDTKVSLLWVRVPFIPIGTHIKCISFSKNIITSIFIYIAWK